MYPAKRAHPNLVFQFDVPADMDGITEYDFVFDFTIMANVHPGHKITAIAHACFARAVA